MTEANDDFRHPRCFQCDHSLENAPGLYGKMSNYGKKHGHRMCSVHRIEIGPKSIICDQATNKPPTNRPRQKPKPQRSATGWEDF